MEEKILTQHPESGKSGVNISRQKYDVMREAILDSIGAHGEVYKPAAKRKYGYYVLPVIYGDRFVARFDPAFDKKSRELTITNWWWEEGIQPDETMKAALIGCFHDFLSYLDAGNIQLGENISGDKTLRWASSSNTDIVTKL